MIYQSYRITEIIAVFIAIVASMTLHEYAHGVVALWNGDYTAKSNGRLTLNPLKHFDVIGFLMLMTVGYGYAKPVPVNPYNFKHPRRGIFTVSIAGICMNLILAFVSTALYMGFGVWLGNVNTDFGYKVVSFFWLLFFYMTVINTSLAVFNLLPLYPLDGFRILESFTRYNNKITSFLRVYGRYILIGLIGISIIIDVFDLVSVSSAFYYIDILGLIMDYAAGGIQYVFRLFWGLIIVH